MRHAEHGRPGQNDRVKTGTRIAAANALMGVGVAPMLHWFAMLADAVVRLTRGLVLLTAALLLLPWVAVLALWLGRYVA